MLKFFRKEPPKPQPLEYKCPHGPDNQYLQKLLPALTPEERAEFDQVAAGTSMQLTAILFGSDNLRSITNHAFGERTGSYPSVIGEPEDLESAA
ncbi:hypothetical protein KA119_02605 [Candidatus Gracilibacteria bacterium]|nr:hypothetical protein [Candidatus Gracilibacteria bacterium]